jgi:hypothetical protein
VDSEEVSRLRLKLVSLKKVLCAIWNCLGGFLGSERYWMVTVSGTEKPTE